MSNENKKVIDMTENENEEIAALRQKVETLKGDLERTWEYLHAEEQKVKVLLAFIKSGVDRNEWMCAGDLMEKIIKTF